MKVVIAPQAFKGTLTGMQAAMAIERGVRRVLPDCETVLAPVADGGDGTVDALVTASGGALRRSTVTGPLGEPVVAAWGVLQPKDGRTAVIEMATAAGLALVPPGRRDPRVTTTRGVGELIHVALNVGCRRFIVGLGGSATNDGGAGMAQALGARLADADGRELPPGGAALARLDRIDASILDIRLGKCHVQAATDVTNPLCGPDGASAVYGPQKGATPSVVVELEAALRHYAAIMKRDLGVDVMDTPGAGAGGGLGASLIAFLGARLRSGIDLVCDAIGFDQKLRGASLAITGEGRLDGQTINNKAPIGVARRAQRHRVPVLAVVGSLGPGHEAVFAHGIDVVEAATPGGAAVPGTVAEAAALLEAATERAVRRFVARG